MNNQKHTLPITNKELWKRYPYGYSIYTRNYMRIEDFDLWFFNEKYTTIIVKHNIKIDFNKEGVEIVYNGDTFNLEPPENKSI